MPLPLSIFIIAHNEADRIGCAIEAIKDLSEDILLVDSGSTDGTQEIARALGANVIHNPWPGYGEQKRFAEDRCRHDWRLNLDADEVVTPELREEIAALFAQGAPPPGAYSVRVVDVMPGDEKPRPLPHAFVCVRLYHKNAGRFAASAVHDRVEIARGVSVIPLKGTVYHFSIRTLGEQIAKFNRYTDALVADLRKRNVRIPLWRLFLEFPASFLKAYFLRRHFLHGTYGYMTAMNYAFFRHMRVAKYFEAHRMNDTEKMP